MAQTPPPTLTTGQIAGYCRVNYRTVIRWIKRGWLKAHQLPGRGDHRVEVEDFLDFLKTHRMPVPIEFGAKPDRVLIVEDDLSMARSIQRALRRAGFETSIAENGFQAGTMIGSFRPSLLTLDLQMPGLGGMEVLRFVRTTEHLSDTRVLVVSGLPQDSLAEAMAAGADDVLGKPFKNEVLVEKARNLVPGGVPGENRVYLQKSEFLTRIHR